MTANSRPWRIKALSIFHKPRTLRNQLIVSVWLGMGIILVPSNIYTVLRDRDLAIISTQQKLLAEGTLAASAITRWERSIGDLLEVIASTPAVRDLNQQDSQAIFNSVTRVFPQKSFALWAGDGALIAASGISRPVTRQQILARPYFQKTRQGIPSWGIFDDCLRGSACYVTSVPVFATGKSLLSTPSIKPVGVLTNEIRLQDTGSDSGMEAEERRISEDPAFSGTDKLLSNSRNTLSLQNNDFTGIEVLMISGDGHVIFPMSTINDNISVLSPSEIAKGPWGPVVNAGKQSSRMGQFGQVESKSHAFIIYSKKINEEWSVVAATDKETSLNKVYQQVAESAMRQLVVLSLITLVIVAACRNAAKPIQVAAAAVREFRFGNFDAQIHSERDDEIGELYNDINQTGRSLRGLLNEKLAHAVTDKQIQIAANIQQEFVIQSLPSTSAVELVADFDPAYEVGADWYDAISLGDVTYIVIADVCDKGIASALFMSVFQSLLHYSLLEASSSHEGSGPSSVIHRAITQVNDYMAVKHGKSAMFATLFLAAYDLNSKRLSYVSAGHESPLIVRSQGIMESLEVCGPAVGIFPGAKYTVKQTDLKPGEILFTYTDGLIDARSPSGEAWGIERVKAMLSTVEPAMTSAADVLASTIKQVNYHRADAEQFDDMTLLVMKVNL